MSKSTNIFLILILIIIVVVGGYFLISFNVFKKNIGNEENVYKVGILSGLDFFDDTTIGFKLEMEKLGYKEGKNIVYDIEKTNFDTKAYERILTKFINEDVDLIFVFPTEAALMAKDLTKETKIPVLFANASIEGVDLIDSLSKPGINITGVRRPDQEIAVERFNIMREILPSAKRIMIPYQRGYSIVAGELEKLQSEAKGVGIEFIELPADNGAELASNLQNYIKEKGVDFDAVLLIAEPLTTVSGNVLEMAKILDSYKIPIGGILFDTNEFNTLFGFNVDNVVAGGQAAPMADRILTGTSAGSIPVVTARTFLQINLKAAERLGIKISNNILSRASEVVR